MIEKALLCAGFFLLASDQVWVVVVGIGMLALAGLPRKEKKMELSMTDRMTRRNPGGRSYRVPMMCLGHFEFKQDKASEGVFGDLADRLGAYEDCLTLKEAMEYARKKEK